MTRSTETRLVRLALYGAWITVGVLTFYALRWAVKRGRA